MFVTGIVDPAGLVTLAIPFVGGAGPYEFLILAVIALLLFGKRLPEVAKSLGKGIVEFKRGIQGIEDEVDRATYATDRSPSRPVAHDDENEVTAPRFEPPDAPPS